MLATLPRLSTITSYLPNINSVNVFKRYTPYNKPVRARTPEKKVGYLYAFCTRKDENMYKVGKTIDLKKRIRSHKTTCPDGVVTHSVKCDNIHHAERILHDLLKMKGHHHMKEVFIVSETDLISYMNMVANM
jgi:hypothetical protein